MSDLDRIFEALEPELTRIEGDRRAAIERARATRNSLLIGTLAVAIVLVTIGASTGRMLVTALVGGIGWLIVAGIIYGVRTGRRLQQYKRSYKTTVVRGIVRELHPDLGYDPEGGVPKAAFERSNLFSHRADRYAAEDGFRGRIGQTDVLFSEVTAKYEQRSTDSKGNTTVRYVTFFDGIFMIADFHKAFRGRCRVLPDQAERLLGRFGKALQGMRMFSEEKLVYVEDPEFEKHFVVYGTDQIEARYLLSTSMLARIVDLKKRWSDDVYLSFMDSTVSIAIEHGGDLFEPSVKKSALDRDQVERFASELEMCFGIVGDLNLNTRIWSK